MGEITMNSHRVFSTLACMFIACGVAFASPAQQYSNGGMNKMFRDVNTSDPTYTSAEVQKMVHDAATSADYKRLADYFDYRSMQYEQKSDDQLKELQRLLALPYHARTYQSQVDYTREQIKRGRAKAEQYSTQADTYREQANATSATE
jgi:D-alanyl-D-alanine carboxypeptidase